MYYQLGNIIFESLIGPNSLSQSSSVNFAQHDTIESKPRLQKIGTALDKVSMGIKFHSRFCNPDAQVQLLKDALNASAPLPLITGAGIVLGYFVLASVDVTTTKTNQFGESWELDCGIELIEYFDPNLEQERPKGFANSSQNPILAPGQSYESDTVAVDKSISDISNETDKMDKELIEIENNPAQEAARRENMKVSTNKISVFTDNLETASNADKVIDTLAALRAYLGDFRTATAALKALLTSGSITDVRLALANLQLGLDNVKVLSAGTLIIYATRRG
jgi:phage protein U